MYIPRYFLHTTQKLIIYKDFDSFENVLSYSLPICDSCKNYIFSIKGDKLLENDFRPFALKQYLEKMSMNYENLQDFLKVLGCNVSFVGSLNECQERQCEVNNNQFLAQVLRLGEIGDSHFLACETYFY